MQIMPPWHPNYKPTHKRLGTKLKNVFQSIGCVIFALLLVAIIAIPIILQLGLLAALIDYLNRH